MSDSERDRYELYQRLLEAAAAQLGCDTDDDKAKDLACLRLMRESVTLRLIAGKDCNPADLRWLTEELAKFAPPPKPVELKIEVVGRDGVPVSELSTRPMSPPPAPADGGPSLSERGGISIQNQQNQTLNQHDCPHPRDGKH